MNKQGQIFLLPELLFGIIVLIILAITFLFAKNFFVMIVAFVVGGFVLWKVAPMVEKKDQKNVLAVGGIIILAGLMIGIINPFSIGDGNYCTPSGDCYKYFCDSSGICFDKQYYSSDDSTIKVQFLSSNLPEYGFYVKTYIDGALVLTQDSKDFVKGCANYSSSQTSYKIFGNFVENIPTTNLSSGLHKISFYVGKKPKAIGTTSLLCGGNATNNSGCPFGLYSTDVGYTNPNGGLNCLDADQRLKFSYFYNGSEFDQLNTTQFALLADHNFDFINRNTIVQPPIDSGLSNGFFDGLIDWLKTLLGEFGFQFSIAGNSQTYVGQALSVDINMVSPEVSLASGAYQKDVYGAVTVVDSQGHYVFKSVATKIVSPDYSYHLTWTPTTAGKYFIVAIIQKKDTTFSPITGHWGTCVSNPETVACTWTPSIVIANEKLQVNVIDPNAPIDSGLSTNFFDSISNFFSWIRSILGL